MNVTRFADWDLKSIIRFGFVLEKKNPDCFSADKMKKKCAGAASICAYIFYFFICLRLIQPCGGNAKQNLCRQICTCSLSVDITNDLM